MAELSANGARQMLCCARWLGVLFAVTFGLVGCSPAADKTPANVSVANASRPGIAGFLNGNELHGNDAGFAHADRPREFSFPADDGAHPDYRTEWWYLTGQLTGSDGQRFGFQFTVFRQALVAPGAPDDHSASAGIAASKSAWRSRDAWLAHLAITDIDQRKHWAATRLARGALGLAGASAAPFAVWVEDWRLEQPSAAAPWQLHARDAQGLELNLQIRSTQPEVLHGEGGWSRKGVHAASYYFSRPRLQVTGFVQAPGSTRVAVRGTAWLDREWSTSALAPEQIGWDWFALRLGDGRGLMLFQLRHQDGKRDAFDAGTLISKEGVATRLRANDFTLVPGRRWRDEQGVEWPVDWRLTLREPGKATQHLAINAAVDDQLMRVGLRYWEGAVTVTARAVDVATDAAQASGANSANGASDAKGEGYLEMTGYQATTQ